jgi:hypothetical protein
MKVKKLGLKLGEGFLAMALCAAPGLAQTGGNTGPGTGNAGAATGNYPGTYHGEERGNDWGWIGLLGLIGLAGLIPRRGRMTEN